MGNRVACGSSHSLAWTVADQQMASKHEPVIFVTPKDPLGSSLLGLYDSEKTANQAKAQKNQRPSLTSIVMSLESNTAKQQALQHILNSIHIQQLRQCVVNGLNSHSHLPKRQVANVKVSFKYCRYLLLNGKRNFKSHIYLALERF